MNVFVTCALSLSLFGVPLCPLPLLLNKKLDDKSRAVFALCHTRDRKYTEELSHAWITINALRWFVIVLSWVFVGLGMGPLPNANTPLLGLEWTAFAITVVNTASMGMYVI